MISSNAITFLA